MVEHRERPPFGSPRPHTSLRSHLAKITFLLIATLVISVNQAYPIVLALRIGFHRVWLKRSLLYATTNLVSLERRGDSDLDRVPLMILARHDNLSAWLDMRAALVHFGHETHSRVSQVLAISVVSSLSLLLFLL